ncbi:MAG: SpoIID/LytB domain-containing protein [bacterium]
MKHAATALLAIFAAFFIFSLLPAAPVPDAEPEVRIGVAQKITDVKIENSRPVKLFSSPGVLLNRAEPGTLVIRREIIAGGAAGYRVEVGTYKSYERAEFDCERIRSAFGFPCALVQPDGWVARLGPYSSPLMAANVWGILRDIRLFNANVVEATDARAKITIETSGGKLLYSGDAPVVLVSTARLKLPDGEYRGRLEIAPDSYGTLSVINIVGAEDYLRSVLPAEMPPGAAPEALKAQAIIARTYLVKNLRRHAADGFHLCARPDCQVYRGVGAEAPGTDAAVRATRGMLLTFGGEPANPLFHSTCGGRTAAYTHAWDGAEAPYLVSVDDGARTSNLSSDSAFRKFLRSGAGSCSGSKVFRWSVSKTARELEGILAGTLPVFTGDPALKPGALKNVRILRRHASGRIAELEILTASGAFGFSGDEIRWALGGLKSTLFTVDRDTDNRGETVYNFHGAGWGHGVGMCQTGAMRLAAKGWSAKRILARYYPGAQIQTAWR